jgi:hypothetical protein
VRVAAACSLDPTEELKSASMRVISFGVLVYVDFVGVPVSGIKEVFLHLLLAASSQ